MLACDVKHAAPLFLHGKSSHNHCDALPAKNAWRLPCMRLSVCACLPACPPGQICHAALARILHLIDACCAQQCAVAPRSQATHSQDQQWSL